MVIRQQSKIFLPDDTDLDQSLFEDNEMDDPDQTGLDQFG